MSLRKNTLPFLVFALLVLTSCGPYSFSGSSMPNIKSVAVPLFSDNTSEFGIKEELTNTIIDGFKNDNTLKVNDRRNADSILQGTILSINTRAGEVTRQEQVNEIQIHLLVTIKYEDVEKRKVIWEDQISQFGTYRPGASENNTRNDAITEAIQKITREVLNRSVTGW